MHTLISQSVHNLVSQSDLCSQADDESPTDGFTFAFKNKDSDSDKSKSNGVLIENFDSSIPVHRRLSPPSRSRIQSDSVRPLRLQYTYACLAYQSVRLQAREQTRYSVMRVH